MRIYLDYAAATPLSKKVMSAMEPFFATTFYNPSALYSGAVEAKAALEQARSDVATAIGARPSEIIFTAGGTESANLAVKGVMDASPEGSMLLSAIEHEAVRRPAENYDYQFVPVNTQGIIDTKSFEKLITESTVLVSIMLVNNEIGSVQPIKEVVSIVKNIREKRLQNGSKVPLFVHTDACQAPLFLDVNIARLGVDMMTLNGGKIHGPKQSGILYKKSSVQLKPLVEGGGQEWGLRSGTENVAFAVGFAKALELSSIAKSDRVKHVSGLRDFFMTQLEDKFDAVISGHRVKRAANNIHASFSGVDNERVLFSLDDSGIAAAAGSACQASSEASSHVLHAIGKTEEEARSSVRFSLGAATTKQEIEETLTALETALIA